jgi:hypothetical protein
MKGRTIAMIENRKDFTNVKGSHNNRSNNRSQDNNFTSSNRSTQNINVMKSDTYNIVLTLVAAVVILFSIGASVYTMQGCEHQLQTYNKRLEDLEGKYEVLKELYITKGVK